MTKEPQLRVGYIGTGWTERVQIPAFTLGGLTAQGISSGQRDNAERVAAKYDIPNVFTHWQDMIEAPQVDIVSIVTPPALHCEMAVAALQAGKHVICEKPMALTVAEAETMLAAAQAAPGQLAIIDHELRFHPLRVAMRRRIRDGEIGNLVLLELEWLFPSRLDASAPWTWHHDMEQGGGMLGAVGSHLFDLARWLAGRVDAITAQLSIMHLQRQAVDTSTVRRVTADDHAQLLLKFVNGAAGSIRVSAIQPERRGMRIQAIGTEGVLKLDFDDSLSVKKHHEHISADWQPIMLAEPMIDPAQLPNVNPFAIGSYYLARAVANTLGAGNSQISDAASFYDGLVVQRALQAARACNRDATWARL